MCVRNAADHSSGRRTRERGTFKPAIVRLQVPGSVVRRPLPGARAAEGPLLAGMRSTSPRETRGGRGAHRRWERESPTVLPPSFAGLPTSFARPLATTVLRWLDDRSSAKDAESLRETDVRARRARPPYEERLSPPGAPSPRPRRVGAPRGRPSEARPRGTAGRTRGRRPPACRRDGGGRPRSPSPVPRARARAR